MINSVVKAVEILNTVSLNKNTPMSLGEISEKTDMNKATCSHIVATLLAKGYLKRVSHKEGYILGPSLYCLSRFGKYEDGLVELCHPLLKWLNKKTGFSTVLAVIEGEKKFIIDYIDPKKTLSLTSGSILPDDIYRTATGRAIIFNMSKNQLKEFFQKAGPPPESHWIEVKCVEDIITLSKTHKKQDIVATKSIMDGILYFGYGAPIYKNRTCIGAIGVSALYNNGSPPPQDEFVIKASLLKAQREINRRLEFS